MKLIIAIVLLGCILMLSLFGNMVILYTVLITLRDERKIRRKNKKKLKNKTSHRSLKLNDATIEINKLD